MIPGIVPPDEHPRLPAHSQRDDVRARARPLHHRAHVRASPSRSSASACRRVCGAIKRKGVIYSINWIPFGAFVKMLGEEDPTAPGSFASKPRGIRAIVLAAGSAMNFMLAVVAFSMVYIVGVPGPRRRMARCSCRRSRPIAPPRRRPASRATPSSPSTASRPTCSPSATRPRRTSTNRFNRPSSAAGPVHRTSRLRRARIRPQGQGAIGVVLGAAASCPLEPVRSARARLRADHARDWRDAHHPRRC